MLKSSATVRLNIKGNKRRRSKSKLKRIIMLIHQAKRISKMIKMTKMRIMNSTISGVVLA